MLTPKSTLTSRQVIVLSGTLGLQASCTLPPLGPEPASLPPAPPLDQDGKVGPKTRQALLTSAKQTGANAPLVKAACAAVAPRITAPNAVPEAFAMGAQVPARKVGPLAGLKKTKVPNDVQQRTLIACNWHLRNFAKEIDDACNGTPFDRDLVCAIASKEGLNGCFR